MNKFNTFIVLLNMNCTAYMVQSLISQFNNWNPDNIMKCLVAGYNANQSTVNASPLDPIEMVNQMVNFYIKGIPPAPPFLQ